MPYRLNSGNNVDISILALLAILLLILPIALHQYVYKRAVIVWSMLISLLLGIPHMVLILYLCHKFAKKTGITQCLKTKYGNLKRCVSANRHTIQVQADREAEFNTESLPDRIINPGEYDPMLSVAVERSVAEPNEDKESGARLFPVYTYGSIN